MYAEPAEILYQMDLIRPKSTFGVGEIDAALQLVGVNPHDTTVRPIPFSYIFNSDKEITDSSAETVLALLRDAGYGEFKIKRIENRENIVHTNAFILAAED